MIVKVCGMREADNIRAVEQVGPDWMGFIFYARSPRHVAVPPSVLPTRCRRVGVFVDTPADEMAFRIREMGLTAVQLHGDEGPEVCRALRSRGLIVIKALSVTTEDDLCRVRPFADGLVDYFLFDTSSPQRGGSGRTFDWSILDHYDAQVPFLLSGGLRPTSLDALRRFRHPRWAGIDLNSGFETAPGVKDAEALRTFIYDFRQLFQ